MNELARELAEAHDRLTALTSAADRKRLGEPCPEGKHVRRARQSMAAASGHATFIQRVQDLTGHTLIHAGYHLYECIVCGEWSIDDYCGEPAELPITAESAEKLL